MNDTERLQELCSILKDPLLWYKKVKTMNIGLSEDDRIDLDSLIYDCSIDQFSSLDRGKCARILEILSEVE